MTNEQYLLKSRLRVSIKFWVSVLVPILLFVTVWVVAAEIFPRSFSSEPEDNPTKNENVKSALLPPRPCAENPSLENWREDYEVRKTNAKQ